MIDRRTLLKTAAAALPASSLLNASANSKFGGVQIGTITYSFRTLPGKAEDILKYCTELGISSIELMSEPVEAFAGMPGVRVGGFGGPGGGRPPGAGGPPPGGIIPGAPRAGGRPALTPEQQEAMKKAAEARRTWRTSASMDKFKELRGMFNGAGIAIDVFKLPLSETMVDEEFDYVFTVAKTLGANSITMELPAPDKVDFLKRIGQFADKHKTDVGYHNHMQVNPKSWDTALAISKYNSINLDVGHFTEAISASPIAFIKEHHGRISSMHLKDKKYGTHGGGNLPWGTGEVPLKEVLQLMKKERYSWPANIELEYNIPGESNVMAEMANCLKFCKEALA